MSCLFSELPPLPTPVSPVVPPVTVVLWRWQPLFCEICRGQREGGCRAARLGAGKQGPLGFCVCGDTLGGGQDYQPFLPCGSP